jgi:predicted HicB family RNase H-like nuclease
MSSKDPVQLNLRVDPSTRRQLKIYAATQGIPLNTLLNQAVAVILKGAQAEEPRAA